jgi:hypothetical protein
LGKLRNEVFDHHGFGLLTPWIENKPTTLSAAIEHNTTKRNVDFFNQSSRCQHFNLDLIIKHADIHLPAYTVA